MNAHAQIALLGRRAGLPDPEADAVAGQTLAAHRAEVLREAADALVAKYGVTNRAAGDLRRLADAAESGAA